MFNRDLTRRTSIKSILTAILMMFLIWGFSLPANALPTDTAGTWAEQQINTWVTQGLIQGYPDGTFRPDANVTRAEFIVMTNRAFKFSAMVPTQYIDVNANDWFAEDIAKARAAGYVSGYPDGSFQPNAKITRQEAAVILENIKDLPALEGDVLSRFADAGQIPAWSREAINAVVSSGVMNGYPDQTFKAANPITRAEAVVTLNNATQGLIKPPTTIVYDKAGTYGPAKGSEKLEGNVSINATGVALQNVTITGDLILAEGIGTGTVNLKNVVVQGETFIKGGGSNSVVMTGCTFGKITVSKAGVRIAIYGNTTFDLIVLENNATVEMDSTADFDSEVIVSELVPAEATVRLSGNFDKITLDAADIYLMIGSGTIGDIEINDSGQGSRIDLADGVRVIRLVINAPVDVTGEGDIETAVVLVEGVTIEQVPQNIENPNDVTITIAGQEKKWKGTGGGDNPLNLVWSDPSNGSTNVPVDVVMIFEFDRGVVRDYWDINQECFSMEDEDNNSIDINVSRADNYLDDDEKHNIYVTPSGDLDYSTTYIVTIDGGLTANNGNTLGDDETVRFTTEAGGDVKPAAPKYVSSEVTSTGDVSVTFDKAMESNATLAGKGAQFTVMVDGTADAVTALSTTSTVGKIKLTLTTKVTAGQEVTVAYTKGADASTRVKSADGGVLESFTMQTVTNGLVPAAPQFVSAEVTTQGDVSIYFDKAIESNTTLAGKGSQFTVMVDGTEDAVTALSTTSTAGKIKLTLTIKVTAGQEVTVAYTKGADDTTQVKSADGGVLESFTAQSVSNTLGIAAPQYLSSEVTSTGDVSVTFDKAMESNATLASKGAQFTVMVDGTADVVTALSTTSTVGKIKLTLTTKVTSGQEVTVAYTKGADASTQVKSADGGVLESFTAQTVTNGLVPAAPQFISSEVTTQGDVSIYFDKGMESNTTLASKGSQFTVMVDGSEDIVTALSTTSTVGKIKLTLTTKVTAGQEVTVAYTKGADDTTQVKSADGGVLESFTAQSVSNTLGIAAPQFVSSEVTSTGDISVTFDQAMESNATLAGKGAQFTVMVDGTEDAVTALSTTSTVGKIKLTLTTKVTSGQEVTVAYTKGADASTQVKSADGGVLESFTAQTVTNGLVPAAPQFISSEVTTQGDVSIYFDKGMESNTTLASKGSQFTVMVDGSEDIVTALSTTSTVGKIKLVLTTEVTAGQEVTVAYTKGADDTTQVKSADGGVLESFTAQSVDNNLV